MKHKLRNSKDKLARLENALTYVKGDARIQVQEQIDSLRILVKILEVFLR